MKKSQNNFAQQTHFIGVLLPEDIAFTLEDCRRYMNQAYGCKSGHKTPIHITLVPLSARRIFYKGFSYCNRKGCYSTKFGIFSTY